MKVKVFDKNDNGKIEFTRKELEALLNEVYNDGYREGRDSKTYTWTSPSWTSLTSTPTSSPYYTTTSSSNIDDCANNTVYLNYLRSDSVDLSTTAVSYV